jgi:hypothetical protein
MRNGSRYGHTSEVRQPATHDAIERLWTLRLTQANPAQRIWSALTRQFTTEPSARPDIGADHGPRAARTCHYVSRLGGACHRIRGRCPPPVVRRMVRTHGGNRPHRTSAENATHVRARAHRPRSRCDSIRPRMRSVRGRRNNASRASLAKYKRRPQWVTGAGSARV